MNLGLFKESKTELRIIPAVNSWVRAGKVLLPYRGTDDNSGLVAFAVGSNQL